MRDTAGGRFSSADSLDRLLTNTFILSGEGGSSSECCEDGAHAPPGSGLVAAWKQHRSCDAPGTSALELHVVSGLHVFVTGWLSLALFLRCSVNAFVTFMVAGQANVDSSTH